MKLSAKTRYAARILFYMAKHNPSEPVSSNLLAAKTGISSQFIEQILRQLRLAGITGSVRGAKGGHTLLRKPCRRPRCRTRPAAPRRNPAPCPSGF